MSNVLIIGSSGYIGSFLYKHLQKLNYNVTTVDWTMFGGPIPEYNMDYDLLDKEFYSKYTHIILLAAHSSDAMCTDNHENAWGNNVIRFANLIGKLSENHTLIYASSGSVYGFGGVSRQESSALSSPKLEYDLSKQIIEKMATGALCRTIGLRFGTVNGYTEYARADLMLNAMTISAKTNKNIICFNGVNRRSILGINDCARAIETLIKNTHVIDTKHEIFNLASFSNTIENFANIVGKKFDVPVQFESKITNLFSFELDCNKFITKFNFAFNDKPDNIIDDINNNYDSIKWSIRDSLVNQQLPVPPITHVVETVIEPVIETVIEQIVEPKIIEPETETPNDNVENFGVLFDAIAEPVVENISVVVERTFSPTFRALIEKTVPKESYKRLYNCLCCGSPHLFVVLDLGKQPLANSFHKPDELLEEYELLLMGCDTCWHTQLNIAVNPDILFKNYLYVSGTSKTLKEYFDWFADQFVSHSRTAGKVLDIACNDGTLLDSFKDRGWITFGVDPAENLHPISTAKGHNVICDYWSTDVAEKLPKFDLIIAQNVFAHTADIDKFLEACIKVMHYSSTLIIETSQAEMFDNNEFDTIYHEHISYFSINSMKVAVERAGLYLNHVFKPNVHGKSYSFRIQKTDNRNAMVDDAVNAENYRYNREFYDKYRDNAIKCLNDIQLYIDRNQGKKIIGYGAAAKGMTVINAGKLKLDYIVDDNPLKQGLLCPGSNIPVQNSSILTQETDDLIIVVLAWNFFNEIYKKIKFMRPNNNDKFVTYFPSVGEHT